MAVSLRWLLNSISAFAYFVQVCSWSYSVVLSSVEQFISSENPWKMCESLFLFFSGLTFHYRSACAWALVDESSVSLTWLHCATDHSSSGSAAQHNNALQIIVINEYTNQNKKHSFPVLLAQSKKAKGFFLSEIYHHVSHHRALPFCTWLWFSSENV